MKSVNKTKRYNPSVFVATPKLYKYTIIMRHKETNNQETIFTKAKSKKDAIDFAPKYMGKNYELVSCELHRDRRDITHSQASYTKVVKLNREKMSKIHASRKKNATV